MHKITVTRELYNFTIFQVVLAVDLYIETHVGSKNNTKFVSK